MASSHYPPCEPSSIRASRHHSKCLNWILPKERCSAAVRRPSNAASARLAPQVLWLQSPTSAAAKASDCAPCAPMRQRPQPFKSAARFAKASQGKDLCLRAEPKTLKPDHKTRYFEAHVSAWACLRDRKAAMKRPSSASAWVEGGEPQARMQSLCGGLSQQAEERYGSSGPFKDMTMGQRSAFQSVLNSAHVH